MKFNDLLLIGDFLTLLVLKAVQYGLLIIAILATISAFTGWF